MEVKDCIRQLIRSELKGLSIADVGIDTSAPTTKQLENQEVILCFLNRAYTELYSTFNLRNREIVINKPQLNVYYPVPDDFLYPISAITDQNYEVPINSDRLILNDEDVDVNVSILFPTPGHFTIKGVADFDDLHISMIYAAGPESLTSLSSRIVLPLAYMEAFFAFVGHKAHDPTAPEGMQSKADLYLRRYFAACKKVTEQGQVVVDNLDSNYKLTERGFV